MTNAGFRCLFPSLKNKPRIAKIWLRAAPTVITSILLYDPLTHPTQYLYHDTILKCCLYAELLMAYVSVSLLTSYHEFVIDNNFSDAVFITFAVNNKTDDETITICRTPIVEYM